MNAKCILLVSLQQSSCRTQWLIWHHPWILSTSRRWCQHGWLHDWCCLFKTINIQLDGFNYIFAVIRHSDLLRNGPWWSSLFHWISSAIQIPTKPWLPDFLLVERANDGWSFCSPCKSCHLQFIYLSSRIYWLHSSLQEKVLRDSWASWSSPYHGLKLSILRQSRTTCLSHETHSNDIRLTERLGRILVLFCARSAWVRKIVVLYWVECASVITGTLVYLFRAHLAVIGCLSPMEIAWSSVKEVHRQDESTLDALWQRAQRARPRLHHCTECLLYLLLCCSAALV